MNRLLCILPLATMVLMALPQQANAWVVSEAGADSGRNLAVATLMPGGEVPPSQIAEFIKSGYKRNFR